MRWYVLDDQGFGETTLICPEVFICSASLPVDRHAGVRIDNAV